MKSLFDTGALPEGIGVFDKKFHQKILQFAKVFLTKKNKKFFYLKVFGSLQFVFLKSPVTTVQLLINHLVKTIKVFTKCQGPFAYDVQHKTEMVLSLNIL